MRKFSFFLLTGAALLIAASGLRAAVPAHVPFLAVNIDSLADETVVYGSYPSQKMVIAEIIEASPADLAIVTGGSVWGSTSDAAEKRRAEGDWERQSKIDVGLRELAAPAGLRR